jgi:hypothetical protein
MLKNDEECATAPRGSPGLQLKQNNLFINNDHVFHTIILQESLRAYEGVAVMNHNGQAAAVPRIQ